jgi:hypothetical protein
MMFMMPIPPTTRLTPAIPASRERYPDIVIGIAPSGSAFRCQYTDNLECDGANLNCSANQRCRISIEHLGYLRTQHYYTLARCLISRREHFPVRKSEAVDIRVIGGRADCRYVEILIPIFELKSRIDFRDYRRYMLHARGERYSVVGRKSPLISCYAAAKPGGRLNRKNIPTQRGHLLVDLALRARSECNHCDYRTDANHNAEHGQQRSKQVASN